MDVSSLQQLGLTKTESQVYACLFKNTRADAATLVSQTGLYKANVYQTLQRLIEKSLVSKILQKNKAIYTIQQPIALQQFIQRQKDELEKKELLAQKIAQEVSASKAITTQHTAEVLEGFIGVRNVFDEIIAGNHDYISFGASKESDAIGSHYWKNLHVRQEETGIKAKMIFHENLRHWKNEITTSLIELRFLETTSQSNTETVVYADTLVLIVWSEKPIVTIIRNTQAADSYRTVFDIMWKQSKT